MKTKGSVVVGLGYGDEGKGAVVDHLVHKLNAKSVVRYCGGTQAAHNVITPDGRHHTFGQFGSGTFSPGVETFLTGGMMVNPLDMFLEYEHLAELGEADAWDRLSVDGQCLITTPIHAAANLVREWLRGQNNHGTTGRGIGETRRVGIENPHTALRVQDIANRPVAKKKLELLLEHYAGTLTERLGGKAPLAILDELVTLRGGGIDRILDLYGAWAHRTNIVADTYLADLFDKGHVIFESSQGILLDESIGFHPHTTWSDVTAAAAKELCYQAVDVGEDEIAVVGVIRTYSTRHGAGPFPSSAPAPTVDFDEPHNNADGHAGEFRQSPFDLVAFKYGVWHNQPDVIALTHTDRFPPESIWPFVSSYTYHGEDSDLDDYFGLDEEGRIVEIEGGQERAYIECTTRRLFDCTPNVELTDSSDIILTVELAAERPVTIVGLGPNEYKTRASSPLVKR